VIPEEGRVREMRVSGVDSILDVHFLCRSSHDAVRIERLK
jgi:hypothetical protein